MILNDHLLYFDITNQCGLNCGHCMYPVRLKKHASNLSLTDFSRENISALINHERTAEVVISGEGEPFNNKKAICDILSIPGRNRSFQIVTNGNWALADYQLLEHLQHQLSANDDCLSIRLSVDLYHAKRVGFDRYIQFFRNLLGTTAENPHLTFSIRGILEQRVEIRSFLTKILCACRIPSAFVEETSLTDSIATENSVIRVNYKNLVRLDGFPNDDKSTLMDFIRALENKYGKTFTLGNLNAQRAEKGLDVTIKHDGYVLFYGAEFQVHRNINTDVVRMEDLEGIVSTDDYLRVLYAVPFLNIIDALAQSEPVRNRIAFVNNPYWIMKTIQKEFPVDFERVMMQFI